MNALTLGKDEGEYDSDAGMVDVKERVERGQKCTSSRKEEKNPCGRLDS